MLQNQQHVRSGPDVFPILRHSGRRDDWTGPIPSGARLHAEYVAAIAALHAAEAAREAAVLTRNVALEEVEFLREQLQSTRAYLVEEVEIHLVAERNERLALLAEVALLNEELQARIRDDGARETPASRRGLPPLCRPRLLPAAMRAR
ncbi:MAG TPA: hypothetical protein VHM67_10355 [Gemmatimonadaceae bacterium]|nr:hypothetical protein [Gemmatimonadaceae bacterium]